MDTPIYRISDQPNAAGYWEVTWNDRGRTKRVSTRSKSRSAANRFLAAFILESKSAEPETQGAMTIEDLLDFYQTTHADKRIVDPSRTEHAAKPLKAFFGNHRAADVDDIELAEYARARCAGELGRVVKPGTMRRELEHLRAVLHYAVRNRKRTGVHADHVPHIELPAKSEPRSYVLTEAELDLLMDVARPAPGEPQGRALIYIALARYTAARRHSIETLTWDRVDLARGQIDFREPGRRKTAKRRVPVPIDAHLAQILSLAWEAASLTDDPFVVPGGGSIKRTFRYVADLAGLPKCTPHTLRHTWATQAIERGVDPLKVAGMMGDTLETILANYVHMTPNYLSGALPDRGKMPESGMENA